jgi:WD40 repeat protein
MDEAVSALAFDRTGDRLAAGDLAGEVAVLDATDLARRQQLASHPGGVTVLAWNPDGRRLVSGGVDGTLRIHGASGGSVSLPFAGPVRSARWSPGGDLLGIAAGRGAWVVDRDGNHVAAAPLFAGSVHDVAWVAGGPAPLAVAGPDGIGWFGAGIGSEPVDTWPVHGSAMVLAADPSRRRLASGDLAGVLRIADPSTEDEVRISDWVDRLRRLAWSPCGRRLAVPARDEVVLWELDGLVVEDGPHRLPAHEGGVTELAYRGPVLVTAGYDGTVCEWSSELDGAGAEPARRRHDIGAPVSALTTTTDLVAVGTQDGQVLVGSPDV